MSYRHDIIARHYLPGGLEHGGGIGRMVGYIARAGASVGEGHAIVDTRGKQWSPLLSPPRLLGAVWTIALDGLRAPERIQHIHLAGRGSTLRKVVLAGVARRVGCRHVLHLHDYDYEQDFNRRPPWQQGLVREMFRNASRVIVLGARDRKTMIDLLGVDPAKVIVLPNAVPDPGLREKRPADEPPKIVFLGRLSERKGVPELLAALAHPSIRALAWRAVLAGDGPVDDFRLMARRLGIADRVEMPGWLDEPSTRALCAEADILVLPSHQEGLSMAVLEGMAHGLAVVTTPVGAHGEVVLDDVNGILVPPGDAEALAAALARLVTDGATRERLGVAARAHFLAHYNTDQYLRSLRGIYRSLTTRSTNVRTMTKAPR